MIRAVALAASDEQPRPAPLGGHAPSGSDELAAIERLTGWLGPAGPGEVWIGDDAAVLEGDAGPLLLTTDLVAEGVHFDRSLSSLADVGWKVLTANVSDVAAMGGRPLRAVVAVAGAFGEDLEALYEGLREASATYRCPIVGGDLSDAPKGGGLVISVSVLGTSDGRAPVLRSGARAGDRLFVTGELGAAAAGLRLLRAGGPVPSELGGLPRAHRRPKARLLEGIVAAKAGASAMLDLSDGLGLDLDRLCRASAVGAELARVPVARGATLEEALGGGEDYELLIAASSEAGLAEAFVAAGLEPPVEIGRLVADPSTRRLSGRQLAPVGYRHGAPR
jgi:thiamine-monophosphate kinase